MRSHSVIMDSDTLERLRNIRDAAYHLVEDIKRRHPGEELRCPYVRALERSLSEWQNN